MSQLSSLLNAREPMFSVFWSSAEKRTGKRGLEAETIGRLHKNQISLISELNLNPDNTTGEELYEAINARFLKDSAEITKLLPDLRNTKPTSLIDWPLVFRNFMANKPAEINQSVQDRREQIKSQADEHKQLEFWNKYFLTAKSYEGIPVSANIYDVVFNALHHIPFADRTSTHFQQALFTDLCTRLHS